MRHFAPVLLAAIVTFPAAAPAQAAAPQCADVVLAVEAGGWRDADVDCTGSPDDYALVDPAANGEGEIGPDLGTAGLAPGVRYQADAEFSGADHFTFTAENADGVSASASVSVTVVAEPEGALSPLPDPDDCIATPPSTCSLPAPSGARTPRTERVACRPWP